MPFVIRVGETVELLRLYAALVRVDFSRSQVVGNMRERCIFDVVARRVLVENTPHSMPQTRLSIL